ncbi:MAG: Asp-tRNA(Asn)/Glu-tRNA(Gln) amidotransferase subunit GatC [Candidatus Omnitrophota bacterium]|nr:Asp-tRNA(Asn)/Glu-tRNA(Gln) amidotransferase subunit GatC [Candidatus Omnitrophota bacterium]
MQIDKKTVTKVAFLSRLELDEKESKLYSTQLAAILSYIDKLNEVDTKSVLPTSHVLPTLKNVFRKDSLKSSLSAVDALSNAPSKEGDFFKVPQVIDPSAGLRVYPEPGRRIEGK